MKPILTLAALMFAAALARADQPTLAISPVIVSPALLETLDNADEQTSLNRVVASLQGQLINAFGQTGKFKVVSRSDLPALVEEQVLGQSGNISPSSAAKTGEVAGAGYVLVVGVDDFNLLKERANFQSISRTQDRTILQMVTVARLYEASTGALLASTVADVTGEDFQQYFAFAQREGNLESAIYTRTAETLADQIAKRLSNQLYPAKVVAKTGKQITINRGSSHGFAPESQALSVYAVGQELIDPDTGEKLGMEEVYMGKATVIRVDDRTTIALLDEDNGVEYGHIVRVE